jgi:Uma2 family endonuclease
MSALTLEAPTRWTIADLDTFSLEEGKRYEVIEGELFVSAQPHWHHQGTCDNIAFELKLWMRERGAGEVRSAPGVIFDDENAVAPDVVWVSAERLLIILNPDDGKLHGAPDLAVKVLSPGARNARRDRDLKRRLYSAWGVREYWLADWQTRTLEVFRREGATLRLVATLYAVDELTSPLLPDFKTPVARLFPG